MIIDLLLSEKINFETGKKFQIYAFSRRKGKGTYLELWRRSWSRPSPYENNEKVAKDAINYLKNNNLGRATFFPINLIKPKYIDNDTLNNLNLEVGFINIASELVKCDSKFSDIIKNQLGNVIVADNNSSRGCRSVKINSSCSF